MWKFLCASVLLLSACEGPDGYERDRRFYRDDYPWPFLYEVPERHDESGHYREFHEMRHEMREQEYHGEAVRHGR